jgi:RNA 3'-terminal phosphate cyclase-like protein
LFSFLKLKNYKKFRPKRNPKIDPSQSLALLLAALGPRDVSRVVTGPLTDYTVHFLRHLKDFFEVVFKLEKFSGSGGGGDDDEQLQLGADKESIF